MRSFEEIIKDCIDNREDKEVLARYYFELSELQEVKELEKDIKVHNSKKIPALKKINYFWRNKQEDIYGIDIESYIYETLKTWNFKVNPPKLLTFKNAVVELIAKDLNSNLTQAEEQMLKAETHESESNENPEYSETDNNVLQPVKNGNYVRKIESATIEKNGSVSEVFDTIKSKYEVKSYVENREDIRFLEELERLGINDKKQKQLLLDIFRLEDLYELKSIEELVSKLKNNDIKQNGIEKFLMKYGKISKMIMNLIRHLFSFRVYATLVKYMIKENNKKFKIPELILKFNKVRNYLSVLFMNSSINDKSSFVKESNSDKSSYEKDIRRILSLFHKKGKKIFDIREDLKKCSPCELSKIYGIHNVPNIVINFLILDIFYKYPSGDVKLATMFEEMFLESGCDEKDIQNFRKNTLYPRLRELEEYGFIKRDKINNKYMLFEKSALTQEQKETLKYVVPFFCGAYPFSSIGHFVANRLNIEDIFEFEAFNLANTLDDCITFDLLTAINNSDRIIIKFRDNRKNDIEITPKELVADKDNNLLKVVCDEGEYYLREIDKINSDQSDNLIFSEIYSFYYRIFEEGVNKYKQNPAYGRDEIVAEMINKYGSEDTEIYKDIIKELLPKLASLNKVKVPLTKLELQWLKTIMQDERFDLFVNEKDKKSLEKLVEDIKPFDLSSYKIYDSKSRKYKSVQEIGAVEGIDKSVFRKNLKELNKILFNVQENTFPDFI